ncbi:hypothetical protein EYF80_067675 [Liparis tanakae]|uniref:Uncharacterized protein n=1 Tax=Liparis tanakae TaxID=230148 RepID=A0A4Z2E1F7_9TELE|nr:hypothetical protein EYF80_067675 [Liparis tanakae]
MATNMQNPRLQSVSPEITTSSTVWVTPPYGTVHLHGGGASSHLQLADTLQLSAVVSADASEAAAGVVTEHQVALLLRQVYTQRTHVHGAEPERTTRSYHTPSGLMFTEQSLNAPREVIIHLQDSRNRA